MTITHLLHEIASFNLCINYSWVKARKGDNHPEFQAQRTRALKCFLPHGLFQSLFAALHEPWAGGGSYKILQGYDFISIH